MSDLSINPSNEETYVFSSIASSASICSSTLSSSPAADDRDIEEITISIARDLLEKAQQPSSAVTSKSSIVSAIDRFTVFAKLPLELRLMVWHFALFEPQVVGISCAWDENQSPMSGWTYTQMTTRCSFIRLVNEEARQEARKVEKALITYPGHVTRPTILTNPTSDTVLFLEQDFDCEFGLCQMLMDLVADSLPAPRMPTVAVHYKWRDFFFRDLETIAENMAALQAFKTEELLFVVGDEDLCKGLEVSLIAPTQQLADVVEADLVEKVRDGLKMGSEEGVSWRHLERYDAARIGEARDISHDASGWTVVRIGYREGGLRG